jgi:hypothetical protein
MAGGQEAPTHLVLDATNIYWNCAGNGTIASMTK